MKELVARLKTIITEEVNQSGGEVILAQTEVQVMTKVLKRIVEDEVVYQQIRELVDWELWERRNKVEV